jgi:ABC-type dipeptide/oligopeptide/nickel transport system permease subunit
MLLKPGWDHLLGTDQFGRDTLTRLIYGTRVSLIVGVLAVAIACFIGVVLGLCAAYFGGWVDVIIMRCSDALMSIPMIMIALALIAIMGQGIANLAIILGISTIPGYIRLMRGQALSVKESDYVKAGQIQGGKSLYMMARHILPNAISPIIVMMTQQIGFAILMEAGLSFIGVGVSIPIASWGTMVADGKNYLMANPILAISPGVAIALLVICFNVLGDGIRDALDPRLRGEI